MMREYRYLPEYRPRVARIGFAFMIIMLAAFSFAYGQTDPNPDKSTITRTSGEKCGITKTIVRGVVVDEVGAVIPGATITAGCIIGLDSMSAVADQYGEFEMIVGSGIHHMKIEANGFETVRYSDLDLSTSNQEPLNLTVKLDTQKIMHSGPRVFKDEPNFFVTVLDKAGAIIPGAAVKAVNRESKAVSSIGEDDIARFIDYLEPGTYELNVTAEGFKTLVFKDLKIEGNEKARFKVQLAANVTVVEESIIRDSLIDFRKTDMSETMQIKPNR